MNQYDISPKQIETAFVAAKQKAQNAGVNPENLDAVALIMASQMLPHSLGNSQASNPSTSPNMEEIPETFAEASQRYSIETHFDRFIFAANYLRINQHVQAVTTIDIMQMYEKARWKKPRNPADVFAKGAQRLYFTEIENNSDEDGLKQWRITRTGLEYLNSLQEVN